MSHYRRPNCRLCDSVRVEIAVPLKPTPIAGDYPFQAEQAQAMPLYPMDLYLCLDCGHCQLLDVVDPDVLFGEYTYVTSSSLGLVEHFRKYAREVVGRVAPGPVVEIGSNDGTLLKFFQAEGFGPVVGVDPAAEVGRLAREQGVDTRCEYFTARTSERLRAELGPVRVIAANNVFAHSDDLQGMAAAVASLLAEDGLFVFEVSYLVDIVERMLFDTVYHEHLCYHAVRPLADFLRRQGLELCEVQRIPTKGGSLRGFARLPSAAPLHPSVAELSAAEEREGVFELAYYQRFHQRIEAAGQALRASLGPRVAGYGASHTVTTLVHQFELGERLEFLVDDNPTKHGSFCPGTSLAVRPPADLYSERPPQVAVLAWAYADPILARHPELSQFAQVLVPLPELKTIERT